MHAFTNEDSPEERLHNEQLRQTLEQLRQDVSAQMELLRKQTNHIESLVAIVENQTSRWTPARATQHDPQTSNMEAQAVISVAPQLDPGQAPCSSVSISEDTGMYMFDNDSLRGFVLPSPLTENTPRPRTQADLVLPPIVAFCTPGNDLSSQHPSLGRDSVQWDTVFASIKQTAPLWDAWCPSRSLDQMSIQSVWDCYDTGEAAMDSTDTVPTGMKPPLRLVEQIFSSEWRKTSTQRKTWQRFREIPEWIDEAVKTRGITPSDAIADLEAMRTVPGKSVRLGTNALAFLLATRRKDAAKVDGDASVPVLSTSQNSTSVSSTTSTKRRRPTIGGRPRLKAQRQS